MQEGLVARRVTADVPEGQARAVRVGPGRGPPRQRPGQRHDGGGHGEPREGSATGGTGDVRGLLPLLGQHGHDLMLQLGRRIHGVGRLGEHRHTLVQRGRVGPAGTAAAEVTAEPE